MNLQLVGLMSCYREGHLSHGAAASLLRACDEVLVLDAPILDAPDSGPESEFPRSSRLFVRRPGHPYVDDASKRSALVEWARGRGRVHSRSWFVVLDGDELLLWPEYLRDWIERNSYESDRPLSVGIRFVELDGSVAMVGNRVLYSPAVARYVVSSHCIEEAVTGRTVVLPNEQICQAGGLPMPPRQVLDRAGIVSPYDGGPLGADSLSDLEVAAHLSRCRPPLAGEAHMLHRSAYRLPTRTIERQHVAEKRELGL